MNNISLNQLLTLWCELEDAYAGRNTHGDTAEIYPHTIMPYSPAYASCQVGDRIRTPGGFLENMIDDMQRDVAGSLFHVLTEFQTRRNCEISVDGKVFGDWVRDMRQIHRWHIQIKRKHC